MQWQPGASYKITYVDASGETSIRVIDLIRSNLVPEGALYLRAYCHLRQDERTFRTDRITNAVLISATQSETGGHSGGSYVEHGAPASRYTPQVVPDSSPLSVPEKEAKHFSLVLMILAGLMSIAWLANTIIPASASSSKAKAVPLPFPTAAYKPAPVVPPKPALEETTIAGYVLKTIRSGGLERFEIPELGVITRIKLEAVSAIRLPIFIESTGLFDPELVGRYLDADLNGSGRLSFDELKVFQDRTYRDFRYEPNELALRPDQFLKAGGGDCEDFALYTAGLLRFWGWEPYIASFAGSRTSIGHAVCFSYEEGAFPKGYTYYEISSWATEDGTALRPGKYVPIDYDHVGSLSGAVGSGWKLRSVYIPEKAWGLTM
jgi:hypothetical protein